jgi:hypothetical protein
MRPPSILDVVQAVTGLAPSHPEVAVWWFAPAATTGASRVVLVLEPREGALPDAGGIGSELAARFGPRAVTVRVHRGAAEGQARYRLFTPEASAAAGHAGGS